MPPKHASKSALIPPSQRKEPYADVEARIQSVITFLHTTGEDAPNLSALAKQYELPYYRLRARWQGRQSKQERPAANRNLSDDQEAAVCRYLDRLDTVGTSARIQMVSGCANRILQLAHTGPDPAPLVSDQWARRFLERHPEYFIRKQRTIDADRKNAHQPEEIRTWFENYHAVCNQYNIQVADTYNFDESGFRIGIGHDQWIITRDPNREAYLGSSTNRDLVTVCETISGDGCFLPPMVIIPGVIHQEQWYTTTSIPDEYLIGTSEKGYSNDELTMDWVRHFEKYSSQRQLGTYRLLLLDGFGSHCTKEFLDFCDVHRIVVFCLPPHTSHLLQPLDVVVFQPYKHYHAEAVETATRSGCSEFDKVEFLDKIDSIRQQTFKKSTIISSFRATGLIPYNPEIVISKLREAQFPSTPTAPTTPPQVSSPTMPQTIRSLKRQGDELLLEAGDYSPSFQHKLKLALQGALAQAQSGALAMDNLEHTKMAEETRNARRKSQNRRQVQKGGVMYASEARQMVKKREIDEVAKAENQLRKAQNAKKRADTQAHKPFLTEIKAAHKARRKRLTEKKKASNS
jgi:hypothetical protein